MYSTAAVHKKYFALTVKWNLKAQYKHNIGSNNWPLRLHPSWLLLLCTPAVQLQLLTITAITTAHDKTANKPFPSSCHPGILPCLTIAFGRNYSGQICRASGAFVICSNKSLAMALIISCAKGTTGKVAEQQWILTSTICKSKCTDVTATLKYWTMQVQALYYASKYVTQKLDTGNE